MAENGCEYLLEPGVLDISRMRADGLYPTDERIKKGPVAVLECSEEIPCNPCETACIKGFIHIGRDITRMPVLDTECSGCGRCLPKCPGLSIFIIDGSLPDGMGAIIIPYEIFPLPQQGEIVDVIDRRGGFLCEGEIIRLKKHYKDDACWSVTMRVPFQYIHDARHFRRKGGEEEGRG